MRQLFRPLLLTALLLLIPTAPFVLFGHSVEENIRDWLGSSPAPAVTAWAIVGVLSTDVFLPIPSSFVSTFGGTQLNIPLATAASWAGMTLGAAIGFALARWVGRPIVARAASEREIAGLERLADRLGPWLLVVTRALPLLAETTVLLMGAARLSWMRFLVPTTLSNLGVALAYSLLGHYGRTYGAEYYALVGSIALPLLAATIVRYRLPVRRVPEPAAETSGMN